MTNLKSKNRKALWVASFLFFITINLYGDGVTIKFENPKSGFTTQRIQMINGTIQGYNKDNATIVINGIPQRIMVNNGRFSINSVVASGLNRIELIANRSSKSVNFYASVPKRDVKIVLTWDSKTDVDLWVTGPNGEKCYYSNRSTKIGGNLDVDVIDGYGPETYTLATAKNGSYSVDVQYYGSYGIPITRVNLYVILKEGTAKEKVKKFSFVMTKAEKVYHITNFNIDKNN